MLSHSLFVRIEIKFGFDRYLECYVCMISLVKLKEVDRIMASVNFSTYNYFKLRVSNRGENKILTCKMYPNLVKDMYVSVGDYTCIGNLFCRVTNKPTHIFIGKYCSLSDDIKVMIGCNHEYDFVSTYDVGAIWGYKVDCISGDFRNIDKNIELNYVYIGNDVWIGQDVTIMDGVHIGNGAICATGSVITKDVPPYAIVGGNPAKVIRYRFSEEEIKKLNKIKWWHWDFDKIYNSEEYFRTPDIDRFIERFYSEDVAMDTNAEFIKSLQKIKHSGKKIVYYEPDFYDDNTVLGGNVNARVIEQFIENSRKLPMVLILAMNSYDANNHIEEIKVLYAKYSNKYGASPNIIVKIFNVAPLDVMQHIDYIVLNHRSNNLIYMDYCLDNNVTVLSAFANFVFQRKH